MTQLSSIRYASRIRDMLDGPEAACSSGRGRRGAGTGGRVASKGSFVL